LNLLEEITFENLEQTFLNCDYDFFSQGAYNLNIFGIRRAENRENKFDDVIAVAYFDEDDKFIVKSWEATVDPGKYWLNKPMNQDGTAILVPDQYRGAYKIGFHRGYRALIQYKDVRVYRDNNKNSKTEMDEKTIQEGMFHINIHRSSPYGESYLVEKWSAGCQVFKKLEDYNEFMGLVKKSAERYGDVFTYTLFNEEDFRV
jgi:hypothetical protein